MAETFEKVIKTMYVADDFRRFFGPVDDVKAS